MTNATERSTPGTRRAAPLPRRGFLRASGLAVAAASVAALAGCGGERTGAAGANQEAGALPDYYPDGYDKLVEGSKEEGGTLTIYSNTDQENWAPVFAAFQEKFPWVGKISANNLDSDEVFQRILSEQATGGSPADLVVSNAAQGWAEFHEHEGTLADYTSPELAKLPEFTEVLPGVVTMSLDPMTIAFNTAVIPEGQQPTGLASLAEAAKADPDTFRDKITARDVEGAFGFTISYAFVTSRDDPEEAWRSLEVLLPMAKSETSSGNQTEKLTTGEYVAGFFISGAVSFPLEERSGGLVKTTFLDDGTVVLPRGVGITAKAPHPNTAKLFVDFLLSQEGQAAVAKGGLTAYREGVPAEEGNRTYADLVEQVGEDKVIFVEYERVPEAEVEAFTSMWNGLLAR